MIIKKILLSSTLALCVIPAIAFATANITVTNNTNHPATGKTSGFLSPCSSKAPGDNGIIKPHGGQLTIPKEVMDLVCSKSCDVKVYMNNNCNGSPAAIAKVDHNKGIMSIQNQNSEGYVVSGAGESGQVTGGPAWYNFFSKLFS